MIPESCGGASTRLRNILVHAYLDIDHSLTHEAIEKDLHDLEEFAAAAAGLL